MAIRDEITTAVPPPDPYGDALFYYEVGLSVLMMVLGLWQWAVIVGLFSNAFDLMRVSPKIATMYMAVAYVVAAVGLWMRVGWGRVIFIVALGTEITIHTVFIATFGTNWPIVILHVLILAVYATLAVLARRRPARAA